MTTAAENAGYARTSYYFRESYTYEAQVALQNAKKSLKKISKACGSYWEFVNIKNNINAAYSNLSYWSVYSCSYLQVLAEVSNAYDYIEDATEEIKKYEE
jgi:DNA repair ATPase RecN